MMSNIFIRSGVKRYGCFKLRTTLMDSTKYNSARFYCEEAQVRRMRRVASKIGSRPISAFSLFLLVIPVSTFALGSWQIKRKKWKDDLIKKLRERTAQQPIDLPENLSEIDSLEYYPVKVKGKFDHSREFQVGPRPLIIDGNTTDNSGSIISSGSSTGWHVVTPFVLSDRDLTILVNRGWVPHEHKKSNRRDEQLPTGEIELVGVVRLAEQRPTFSPDNVPSRSVWFYRDLDRMAELTGASPIFLDAVTTKRGIDAPIGGQTRITLRNEHLTYILTWYGLSLGTAIMWYRHYIHRVPVV